MNRDADPLLDEQTEMRILQALDRSKKDEETFTIDREGVSSSDGTLVVPVKPEKYPDTLFDFLYVLGSAELELRDAGLNVRLSPAIRQRLVVVAVVPEEGEVVYLSEDGREWQDLESILSRKLPELTEIEGIPFDGTEEAEVISLVLKEHPNAKRLGRLAS